jgi:hypothetical protein
MACACLVVILRPGRKENPSRWFAPRKKGQPESTNRLMKYLFRLILILVVLAMIAVIAYAYIGDLSPMRAPISEPVELEAR